MNLTLDSDVIVFALTEPRKEIYKKQYDKFAELHKKAEQIFESIISGTNKLIIPVTHHR